jgi:TRAP-type C4-dicarboxylate transport system substrate-binding protein
MRERAYEINTALIVAPTAALLQMYRMNPLILSVGFRKAGKYGIGNTGEMLAGDTVIQTSSRLILKFCSRMLMKLRRSLCLLCISVVLSVPLSAQVIKLGSLAPEGSPWDKALRRIAVDWNTVSNGRLRVRVFPGGIAGDEPNMVRKIRINQLQAAAITGVGLGSIVEDIYAVQLPLLIRTTEEMEYVMAEMEPTLNGMLEEKGFTMVAWFLAGWAHLFSKAPAVSPGEVKRLKLQVDYSAPAITQAYKELGFRVVPVASTEVLTALQSDMIEAFLLTPLTAAAMQWFGLAKNMMEMPMAPMISGIVISERVWDGIPDDLKPKLLAVVEEHLVTLSHESAALEQEAVAIMLENGLQIHPVSSQLEEQWERVMSEGLDLITGRVVSTDMVEEVKLHLEEYRQR